VKRLAALIALAVATTAAVAGPAQAKPKLGFFDAQYAFHNTTAFYTDLTTLNAKVLRFNASWDDIAPTRPKNARDPNDPAYKWTVLDKLLRDAGAYGKATIVVTIWYTPRWARWAPVRNAPKVIRQVIPNPPDLGNFAYALASRYSGKYADPLRPGKLLPLVPWFEIGDEPSINNGLFPQCVQRRKVGKAYPRLLTGTYKCPKNFALVTPRLYARQVTAGYRAIKQAAKLHHVTQKVLGVSFSNQHSRPFARELRRLLGKNPPWDAISVHPYNDIPRLGLKDRGAKDGVSIAGWPSFLKLIDRLWPRKKFHFWITEYGWQTNPPDPFLGVRLSLQAKYLRQSIAFFDHYRRIDAVINYLIVDEPYVRLGNNWQSGLRRSDGTKKPAFATWQALGARH
jgi:hypothetical protein